MSVKKYILHNKQFLISKNVINIPSNWGKENLEPNLFLYFSKNLSVQRAFDLDGCSWFLLGKAIKTDGIGKAIEDIENHSTREIFNISRKWAGRWVLIGNGFVYPDASCLLGIFYNNQTLSSSLALIEGEKKDFSEDEFGSYPLPSTRYSGTRKLLPSQYFDTIKWTTIKREIPKEIKNLSYQDTLKKIISNLTYSFKNLNNENNELHLAVTAGYDSRLLLSLCSYSDISVKGFTQLYKTMSHADKTVPEKITEIAGYSYKKIDVKEFDEEKMYFYDKHTGRDIFDADRKFFSNGQWDWVTSNDTIIRGGLFELGRCFYWSKLSSKPTIDEVCNAFKISDKDKIDSLREWLNSIDKDVMDLRDRLYLEQRISGWLSAIEQSLDTLVSDTFHPANSYETLSLLLTVPIEKRLKSEHHIDIIKMTRPELLTVPFNQKKLVDKVSKIKDMPLKTIFQKVKDKLFVHS